MPPQGKVKNEIVSKPVARNVMESGFMKRPLWLRRMLYLRKVKLKNPQGKIKKWQILNE